MIRNAGRGPRRIEKGTGIEAGQNRIDTSALAPGLYLVRIGSETVKMIRK